MAQLLRRLFPAAGTVRRMPERVLCTAPLNPRPLFLPVPVPRYFLPARSDRAGRERDGRRCIAADGLAGATAGGDDRRSVRSAR